MESSWVPVWNDERTGIEIYSSGTQKQSTGHLRKWTAEDDELKTHEENLGESPKFSPIILNQEIKQQKYEKNFIKCGDCNEWSRRNFK